MMTPAFRRRSTGPRSTIRTLTERPLLKLVTRTTVPNAYVGCAVTIAVLSNLVPLAVTLPCRLRAEYEARPTFAAYVSAAAGIGRASAAMTSAVRPGIPQITIQ